MYTWTILKWQQVDPTPRPDRISRDFSKEYPSVEVEPRKVLKQFPEKKKHIEKVRIYPSLYFIIHLATAECDTGP